MIVLLTGPTGFIGRRLKAALEVAGHIVVGAYRTPPAHGRHVLVDFNRDITAERWLPHLQGVDAVINAVGIIRETGSQRFATIHEHAPKALFDACVTAGVTRVVQISALGADDGTTRYFSTKHAADVHLASLPLQWTIVQPSLVYGADGVSARLFTLLATLPVVPTPGRGEQQVQPIYVDDLIDAVVAALTAPWTYQRRVALVGPQPLTLREFLRELRTSLGRAAARCVAIPMSWMRIAAYIGEKTGLGLLDRDTLHMLESGNTADPSATQRLLGRAPRSPRHFVAQEHRHALAMFAHMQWLQPLLRFSIAMVWIWTAIVSAGLYPRAESYTLLMRTGVPESLTPVMLFGAVGLNLLFGLGTLFLRQRRWLWIAQLALIAFYTAIITWRLPEFWLHPYGPMHKNLPMLAAIYMLYVLEDRRWNT